MTTDHAFTTSPQTYARTAGIFYLIIIIAGIFGELFVRGKLIVSNDAAATAANITAHQQLWRLGIAGDLLMHICDVPVMLAFYVLLKPVNKNIALMMLLFNLVQTAMLVTNKMNLLSASFYLADAAYLKAFSPDQLHTLTYLAIRSHDNGFGVGLIFFGCECLVTGYLIRRSGYLPRLLGVLMQIAGLCYLLNSFALIIAPSFGHTLNPLILLPPFLAELSLCLWLLIKGVNMPKWNAALHL